MLPVRTSSWRIARIDIRRRPSTSPITRYVLPNRKTKENPLKPFRCSNSEGETSEESRVSQRVLEGGRETRRNLKWSKATVTENKAASVDGTVRILVLSIEDHVDFMDGRKLKLIQNKPRWIDDYSVPGQFIGVRGIKNGTLSQTDGAERLVAITSSPNEARENSALLDATLLEVIVDRDGDEDGCGLGYYKPGDVFEVTQALGRGFSSLFSSYIGLQSALEERRDLLMICYGSTGMGLMRSALNWTPVMATATTQQISFILIAPSMTATACLPEWDRWRENGVRVFPLYETPNGDELPPGGDQSTETRLNNLLFHQSETFKELMKHPMECAVLMAGLPSSLSSFLDKRLTEHGVSRERFLFCEFF